MGAPTERIVHLPSSRKQSLPSTLEGKPVLSFDPPNWANSNRQNRPISQTTMSSNSHLTHLPLQAMRHSFVSIATGLRAADKNGGSLDLLDLQPIAVCTNALILVRQASPMLERMLITLGPFAVLGYGIYKYVYQGMSLCVLIETVTSHFKGTITIPSDHKLNKQIMEWQSKNGRVDTSRLTLQGQGFVENNSALYGAWGDNRIAALSYIPAVGSTSLRFRGHKLTIHRGLPKDVQIFNTYGGKVEGATKTRDAEIVLSCYSLNGSTEILKVFLEHIRLSKEQQAEPMTTFYRMAKDFHRGMPWNEGTQRPARGLNTIVMEQEKKDSIVDDVATYLASKDWYKTRGIPHRRGLLFYGPP